MASAAETQDTASARQADDTAALEACDRLTCAFDLLGKRWTALILDLLLQRPARFSELAEAVPGLSNRVMTDRLRELTDAGLVEREVDPGPPTTITYALTPLGEHLGPALEALRVWARELPAASELGCREPRDGGRDGGLKRSAGSSGRKG
jgi:DNA-binding HxlR family transcriptional regulator